MTRFRQSVAAVVLATLVTATAGYASDDLVIDRHVLSLAAARRIVAASEAEAKARGVGVVIVVVDSSGTIIELTRMDSAQVYRRPSRDFEDQIRTGRIAALALADATPLQGGVPVIVNGAVVGAVGVSGDTPQVDEDIAIAGASAIR